MINTKSRSCWLLVMIVVAFYINACAKPQAFIADTKILSPEQFSSQNAPEVRVRSANPKEIEELSNFPGKKDFQKSDQISNVTHVIMLPIVLPLALIYFAPDSILNPNKGPPEAQLRQQALEQFPNRLTAAIKKCFMVPPPSESPDILEIVYLADSLYILDMGDPCFVVHAQITFRSISYVLFQQIIRIDPRAFSDDIKRPECTDSPDILMKWADETIPRMIQTRLPGLPWKTNNQ